jgi:MFS family permease
MLSYLDRVLKEYPSQFRLMCAGLLISSAGASMIWPFLMIYTSEKLSLPLSTVAALITINAITGLFASFIAGAVADRVGRKLVMVVSLIGNGIAYLFMGQANSYAAFAGLMILAGASNPLYQVGADAMLADMIPPQKRTSAYAVVRMINNVGIAIGPAAGGFLASRSYIYAFLGAAAGMTTYSLLLILRARETLVRTDHTTSAGIDLGFSGYVQVFQNRFFIAFALATGMGLIAPAMLWVLLNVYAKQNYGLSESLLGWIPTTNALMCVFVQLAVTRVTRRFKPLPVIAAGIFVYALGVGSVAWMSGFWGFWLSIVIMTFGELIAIPTISKFIADLAPADLRGRYMSFYWFAWGIARAVAPLLGGWLNDRIAPQAIWHGGLVIGTTSALILWILSTHLP